MTCEHMLVVLPCGWPEDLLEVGTLICWDPDRLESSATACVHILCIWFDQLIFPRSMKDVGIDFFLLIAEVGFLIS